MQKLAVPVPREVLERNLRRVRENIAAASAKAGRAADAVRLVAVTKYVSLAEIQALASLGVTALGESRIQDAEKKIRERGQHPPGQPVEWHLIGHLQTNKADKAVKLFQAVHSVDSLRVAEALHKEALKLAAAQPGRPPLRCLLEVNVAQEANKFGLPPVKAGIEALLHAAAAWPALNIEGLMTMAPFSENAEATSRPVFRRLRELLHELNAAQCYPRPLTELSMGMTQDYGIAIEEGATLVRVGSALFDLA